VFDLDLEGFFEGLSPEGRVKFSEHRNADRRAVRLIRKGWKAGVRQEGKPWRVEEGTPPGGSAWPLWANIYLP